MNRRRARRPAIASALLAPALAQLCVAPHAQATATAAKPAITITVDVGSVALSSSKAPAGTVSFVLVNTTKALHEVDIVRTTLAPRSLPTKPSGQFDERAAALKVVKEAVKVQAGATRRFTARLTRGSYVLVDNLPGHYRAGEAAALTIT